MFSLILQQAIQETLRKSPMMDRDPVSNTFFCDLYVTDFFVLTPFL